MEYINDNNIISINFIEGGIEKFNNCYFITTKHEFDAVRSQYDCINSYGEYRGEGRYHFDDDVDEHGLYTKYRIMYCSELYTKRGRSEFFIKGIQVYLRNLPIIKISITDERDCTCILSEEDFKRIKGEYLDLSNKDCCIQINKDYSILRR